MLWCHLDQQSVLQRLVVQDHLSEAIVVDLLTEMCCHPVSYTHLDVYKRQTTACWKYAVVCCKYLWNIISSSTYVTTVANFEDKRIIESARKGLYYFYYNLMPVSYTHLDVYKRQQQQQSKNKTTFQNFSTRKVSAITEVSPKETSKVTRYESCLLYTSRCV